MGDCQDKDLRVQFDRRLKVKFLGNKVTTDARLLAYRELDEAFALTEMVQDTFQESRIGSNNVIWPRQQRSWPSWGSESWNQLCGNTWLVNEENTRSFVRNRTLISVFSATGFASDRR